MEVIMEVNPAASFGKERRRPGREIRKITLENIKLRDGGYLSVSRSLAFTTDGTALIAAGRSIPL